jgi:5-hydroxyisourate hydrolase-like protein (transthyretin family)
LEPGTKLEPAVYKMIFGTGDYFEREGKETFYPRVEVGTRHTRTLKRKLIAEP